MKRSFIFIAACLSVIGFFSLFSGCTKSAKSPAESTAVNPTETATAVPVPTTCYIMGGNSTGATNDEGSAAGIWAVSFTAKDNATLTELTCKFHFYSSGQFIIGIYSDGGGYPSALLAQTSAQTVADGINSGSITPLAVTANSVYWLAVSESGASPYLTSGSGGISKYMSYTYTGTFPATTVSANWSTYTDTYAWLYVTGCR